MPPNNQSEAVEYEDRYVLFVDMLGFSELVRSGQWQAKHVLAALAKAKRVSSPENDFMRSTHFSDCIVISVPADDLGFLNITQSAFFLAIELVQNRVLLRGGIVRGQLFHGKEHVFGPALIEAYELESRVAKTPRIILSKELFEQAAWFLETVTEGEIKQYGEVSVPIDPADGYRFIDYFSHTHIGSFDAGYEGLNAHHAMLESMINTHIGSQDPSILMKYGWVRQRLQEAHLAMGAGTSENN